MKLPGRRAPRSDRDVRWLIAALVFQLALIAVVAAPRLSPRLFGDEYLVEVQPVDPTDPFRGAYVDLGYGLGGGYDSESTDVWVELAGKSPHQLRNRGSRRPTGPAIRCRRGDGEFKCGIESFFASQDEARRLEDELRDGAVARIRIDGAGRAAIVGLE
jgi:uncharacterized membrane-anchored protein